MSGDLSDERLRNLEVSMAEIKVNLDMLTQSHAIIQEKLFKNGLIEEVAVIKALRARLHEQSEEEFQERVVGLLSNMQAGSASTAQWRVVGIFLALFASLFGSLIALGVISIP